MASAWQMHEKYGVKQHPTRTWWEIKARHQQQSQHHLVAAAAPEYNIRAHGVLKVNRRKGESVGRRSDVRMARHDIINTLLCLCRSPCCSECEWQFNGGERKNKGTLTGGILWVLREVGEYP